MDQGYQQVPRSAATGTFSLIFFIILCLALIVALTWVVLVLQQKTQDLDTLNSRVNQQLAVPLVGEGIPLSREQPTDGTTLVWGDTFFVQVYDLASKGIVLDDLLRFINYGDKTQVVDQIKTKLTDTNQASVKDLVDSQEAEVKLLQSQLVKERSDLAAAEKGRDTAVTSVETLRAKFAADIKMLQDLRDEYRKKADGQIKRYKTDLAKERNDLKKRFDEARKKELKDSQKITELVGNVNDLESEVARLRVEISGRKPVVATGAVGKVLQTDPVYAFVIMNRGEREHMKAGRDLLVYRTARKGLKAYVGKVRVVVVGEFTSRADIVEQDSTNPITKGDMLFAKPPKK